jgi:hypothetical protein
MTRAAEPKKEITRSMFQRLQRLSILAWLIILVSLTPIVSLIVIVPALLEMQASNIKSEYLVQDTMAKYSANAGVEEVMWRFKNLQPPFTPASPVDSSYYLPEKLNNMTVQVKLLKYTKTGVTDQYIVQSTAVPDSNNGAKIVVEIQRKGTTTTLTKCSCE